MDTRKLRGRLEIVTSVHTDTLHPTIDKVRKKRPRGKEHPKYDSLWYMKKEPKQNSPIDEVVGQEFFRMLSPVQQKTRLVVKKDIYGGRDQYFIISKEISGYRSLYELGSQDPDKMKNNILTGAYNGLGQVLVLALFLREEDLHLGNIGVDADGNVVKIDGGFLFKSNRKTQKEDIAALPRLAGDYPKNWLGIYSWRKKMNRSEFVKNAFLVDARISNNPIFRREVNQMLLKICLLPEAMIKKMILSYGEEVDTESLLALLLQSQGEIREAAVTNASFISYLASTDSVEDMRVYFDYLSTFKTIGKHSILYEGEKDAGFVAEMQLCLDGMREEASQKMEQNSEQSLFARFFNCVVGMTVNQSEAGLRVMP